MWYERLPQAQESLQDYPRPLLYPQVIVFVKYVNLLGN